MARPGLRAHPKFRRLLHLLQEPAPHVRGYLEYLWEVGYEAGNPVIGDALDIELAAEYPGEPGKLCKALLDCRLIDRLEDGRFQIHDLLENAPEYVKKRLARDQQRKHKYAPRNRPGSGNSPPNSELGGPIPPNSANGRRSAELGTTPNTQLPTPTYSPDKPARKRRQQPATKTPRPRDELFDAIAEITGSDPQASGSHVGKVAAALRRAEPPYTPAEVRALPAALAAGGLTVPVTLGVVEKYIGWVRGGPRRGDSVVDEGKRDEARRQQQKLREDHRNAAPSGVSLVALARQKQATANGEATR